MVVHNSTPLSATMTATIITPLSKEVYDNTTLTLSVTIILAIFIVITILGNSLVCVSFYKQPHLRKVTYYPIISLAIADLLCGAIAMPAYISKKHVAGGWQEGVTCDIFRFSYFFTEYASVASLTVISIERFIAIKMPVRHKMWLTERKITVSLVVSWFDAVIVSMLPFFWHKNNSKEPCSYEPTREWSLMVILANVFFPFLIMFCCHFYTLSHALRNSRRPTKHHFLANGRISPYFFSQSLQNRMENRTLKRQLDITRTFVIVVGSFILCWAPSTFYYFVRMVCPNCYMPTFRKFKPIFNAGAKLLTFANSCLNPFIYSWRNTTLRRAIYMTLLGKSEARRRRFTIASGILGATNSVSLVNQSPKQSQKRSAVKNKPLQTTEI